MAAARLWVKAEGRLPGRSHYLGWLVHLAGEHHGWLSEQGHPHRQSGRRSGNPAHPGWTADRELADRDLGDLARQDKRRAAREDRVAPRGDLQRRALQDRGTIFEERRKGL